MDPKADPKKDPKKFDDKKKFDDPKYADYDTGGGGGGDPGADLLSVYDLDVIPVTLNLKLEREINSYVSAYGTIGAGIAFSDLDTSFGDDNDITFFAQASAGLLHNVTESFEVFTGVRAIYFSDPSFTIAGESVDLDDAGIDNFDFLVELGARYNF